MEKSFTREQGKFISISIAISPNRSLIDSLRSADTRRARDVAMSRGLLSLRL